MAISVYVPDGASFVGEVTGPNDGVGVPRSQATFELRRLRDAGSDEIVHPAHEALIVGWIQKQRGWHPESRMKWFSATFSATLAPDSLSCGSGHSSFIAISILRPAEALDDRREVATRPHGTGERHLP
jgi:hypothetical protein